MNQPYREPHPNDPREPVQREVYVERDREVITPPQERLATEPIPNPAAGILIIIGALMAIIAGLLPSGGQLALRNAFDAISTGQTDGIVFGVALIVSFLCGLGALAVGAQMFAAKWHAGPARTGMTLAIVMIVCALAVVIVVGTAVFDGAGLGFWLFALAGIPILIGSLVALSRK